MASTQKGFKSLRYLLLAIVVLAGVVGIVASFHSSNSSSETTSAWADYPPHVRTGSRVDLDCRATRLDSDEDDRLKCQWKLEGFPPGSKASLGRSGIITSFVADVDGIYKLRLQTLSLYTSGNYDDEITFEVTAHTDNAPPIAEAGPNDEVMAGATARLNGGLSHDADDDVLGYSWAFESAPGGNVPTLMESGADAEFVPLSEGVYRLRLVVSDGAAESSPDVIYIGANTAGDSHPVPMAGPDQYVVANSVVQLDASASYSPEPSFNDYTSLEYEWRMIANPFQSQAALSDNDVAAPTFVPDKDGVYLFELEVSDGGQSSRLGRDGILNNKVAIFVGNGNTPPVADGGPDFVVDEGVEITLDGSNSRDPENALLSYDWSIIKWPAGSSNALSSGTAESISFTPDLNGTYLIRLVVNDGQDDSAPDIVRVVANIPDIGTNLPPMANAGPDQGDAVIGEEVTLDGSGSSDPEGQPLTYLWSLLTQPAGSSAVLLDNTSANPTLTPDEVGDYTVGLTVNDGVQDSLPDSVTISAAEPAPYTELTLTDTSLPFLPPDIETATLIEIDVSARDTLVLNYGDGVDEPYVAMYAASAGNQFEAIFFANVPDWEMVSNSHANPVNETSVPSFILKRNSDGQYYKIVMDFTVIGTVVQIDDIRGWNCGTSQANCPS